LEGRWKEWEREDSIEHEVEKGTTNKKRTACKVPESRGDHEGKNASSNSLFCESQQKEAIEKN